MRRIASTTSRLLTALSVLIAACVLAGCGGGDDADAASSGARDAPALGPSIDLGLTAGFEAELIADGLNNPTSIAFSPMGQMTVCESGLGRVVIVKDGRVEPYVTGFAVEYWKPDVERFMVGPLSAVWVNATTLAVSTGGEPDGRDSIGLYTQAMQASGGYRFNPIPPTTADRADRGEGNLTGMSLSADGRTLYVASHGTDLRTWVLAADLEAGQLRTFAAADDHGIATNAPMDTLPWGDDALLVLYAGKGGADDSLLVQWDLATGRPVRRWPLPGLIDAYAMARIPGCDDLLIVGHRFDMGRVHNGLLARVTLPGPGADANTPAAVQIIGSKLRGPTAVAFGPDDIAYVALLGEQPDRSHGQIVAIRGIRPTPAR